MLAIILLIIFISLGYLSGSVCSAIIVSKLFSLPDPRAEGSKNPGATNVLRLAGKKYAAMVLLGDMLKGLFPVLIAQMFGANLIILGFTCLAAVLGHIYPIFFGFKGGKGVATALGALLGLQFLTGVVLIALWLLVANFTRYASLASIVTMLAAPFFAIYGTKSPNAFLPLVIMTALILYKHYDNIRRLIDGKEPKINFKHHQLTDVTDALVKGEEDAKSSNNKTQREGEGASQESKK